MDKKFLSLIMAILVGLLFVTVNALTAADKPPSAPAVVDKPPCAPTIGAKPADVPDELKIENEGYTKDKKGPVKLTHKKHIADYKVKCIECHHVYEKGKNVWKEGDPVKKCGECHDPEKKKGEAIKLQMAYHKNCKTCHKELAEAKKKTGPHKKCTECHEKK